MIRKIRPAPSEPQARKRLNARRILDIAGSIGPLKHAKAHLRTWMRPEKRKPTPALLGLFGAKAKVQFQPKGTVGIISPWNSPVNLTFGPLAGVWRPATGR